MILPIQSATIMQTAFAASALNNIVPSEFFKPKRHLYFIDVQDFESIISGVVFKKKDDKKRIDCLNDCVKKKPGACTTTDCGTTWGAACSDYCFCLHMTANPISQCQDEFKGQTGANPPLALPLPEFEILSPANMIFISPK